MPALECLKSSLSAAGHTRATTRGRRGPLRSLPRQFPDGHTWLVQRFFKLVVPVVAVSQLPLSPASAPSRRSPSAASTVAHGIFETPPGGPEKRIGSAEVGWASLGT